MVWQRGPRIGGRNLISKARTPTLAGFLSVVVMAGALGPLSIIHSCVITMVKRPTVSSWVVSLTSTRLPVIGNFIGLIIVLTIHIGGAGCFTVGFIYNFQSCDLRIRQILLSFYIFFTFVHELLFLYFMFSKKMVEVFPFPQDSYKERIKKIYI